MNLLSKTFQLNLKQEKIYIINLIINRNNSKNKLYQRKFQLTIVLTFTLTKYLDFLRFYYNLYK